MATEILRAALLLAVAFAGCKSRAPELVHRAHHVAPALLVEDTSVLDVATGAVEAHRDVLIVADRIADIDAAGSLSAPEGARRIRGSGATLVPGLIDMHGHVGNGSAPPWSHAIPDPEANLRAFLYCGVTTVLDPCDVATKAFARRARVRNRKLLGPTIYTAGPMITAPGGHPVPVVRALVPWWLRWYIVPRIAIEVASPEEARAAVDRVVGMGADVVKLAVDRVPDDAPRISREALAAAVAEARRLGVRAVAHIGTTEDALDAARAGVSAWMHGVYKERITDDAIPLLAVFHIPMVATIGVFESYALLGHGTRVATVLERETVPAAVLAAFDVIPEGAIDSRFAAYLAQLPPLRPAWRENVRRLRAAGVTILAGSDTQTGVFPGASLHRELHLLTEAGMTPAEAIRAATLDAARFLADGKEPDFGTVTEGKRADLLLVEGDPTHDLDALARIRMLVLGGVVIERVPISEASAEAPA